MAAQASGVNTTRVKLLAFAIGASTSASGRRLLRHPGRLLRPDACSPCRPRSSSSPTSCSAAWARSPGAMAGRRGAHLAAAVPQGPGAAADDRPDVGRRARPGHDDLPAGRPAPGAAAQGRARRARRRRSAPRSAAVPASEGAVMTARRPRADATRRRRLRRRARDAALRRRRQPQRRVAADAPRRDPRRHRAERCRQDVAVQLADRRLHAAGGHDHAGRTARRPRRSA